MAFDENDGRIVIHLDLDCFYCQVESQRLGIPRDQPLAVRQWQGLIAVNYPARAAGVTRHMTAPEALKICPAITLAHVETLGAGSASDGGSVVFGSGASAAARAAAAAAAAGGEATTTATTATATTATTATTASTGIVPLKSDRKASLLRYRDASARVLLSLRSFFPQGTVIEKASIDEFYVDATAAVDEMLSRGGRGGRRGGSDGEEEVDAASAAVAEAAGAPGGVVVVEGFDDDDDDDVEEEKKKNKPFPLDPTIPQDARLAAGAALAARARASVLRETGYTCSAGVSHNKLLSKVASAKFKPDRQAVVPRSGARALLRNLPLSKLPGFGGKLGLAVEAAVARERERERERAMATTAGATTTAATEATSTVTTTTVGDLSRLSLDAIQAALGGDREAAMSVWLSARGESTSRVVEKAAPKSLMAAKSLDAATAQRDVLVRWLWILAEELASRLEADGRPPRSLALHYRCRGMQSERSVSGQAPRATMRKAREVGGGGGGGQRNNNDGGDGGGDASSPRSAVVSVPVPPDASAIAASAEALLTRAMNALVAANGGGGSASSSSSSSSLSSQQWPLVNRLCLTAGDFAPPVATGAASIARFFTRGGGGGGAAAGAGAAGAAARAAPAASLKKEEEEEEEEGEEEKEETKAKAPPPPPSSGIARFLATAKTKTAKEERQPEEHDDGDEDDDDLLSKVDVREQERIMREIERSRGGGGGAGGGGGGGGGNGNGSGSVAVGGGGKGGKGTKRKSTSTNSSNQPAPQQRTIASMFGGVNKK